MSEEVSYCSKCGGEVCVHSPYHTQLAALTKERDALREDLRKERIQWEEYADWLSMIEDHANDPNYGSEAERLKHIAEACVEQNKKEESHWVGWLLDQLYQAEKDRDALRAALELVLDEECGNWREWTEKDDELLAGTGIGRARQVLEGGEGHVCTEGWICEAHPTKAWPHKAAEGESVLRDGSGDCPGPGMPCSNLERLGLGQGCARQALAGQGEGDNE